MCNYSTNTLSVKTRDVFNDTLRGKLGCSYTSSRYTVIGPLQALERELRGCVKKEIHDIYRTNTHTIRWFRCNMS